MINLIKRLWKRKSKFLLKISLTCVNAKGEQMREECVYSGETTQTFEDLKRATSAVMAWVLTDNKNGIEGKQEQDWKER